MQVAPAGRRLNSPERPDAQRTSTGLQSVDSPLTLEVPSLAQRVGYVLSNPWKNYLAPASLLRRLLAGSPSPLLAESFARPGGWRSMELIYENREPLDWLDRQALRDNPISMASRNRRQIVTRRLAGLIARYSECGPVNLLGIGAGPGRHAQEAIAESGIEPERVAAWLIDLSDDAFEYGRALAARLEIASCVHFLKGDARDIRRTLPDLQVQIVKLVGLIEYLTDSQLLELLAAVRGLMTPGASLLTHGLVDAYGTRAFLARVFGLRHHRRTAAQLEALLRQSGLTPVETILEPVGVYPIITARLDR